MAKYEVLIKPSAVKEIEAIPQKKTRQKIVEEIRRLSEDPYPLGAKRLLGRLRDHYRVRQGSYRIVYSVEDGKLVVYIVKVGHRKEIYRKRYK